MSPRKQPNTLFDSCVKKCIGLINSACYAIEKKYPEHKFYESENEAIALKKYLMSFLPVRLFDVLCSKRTSCQYRGDRRLQLHALTHPKITVFGKSDLDNSIPQSFWLKYFQSFTRLVVLDLKFICTDEILKVVSETCLMLQELNTVSRVDICIYQFNASVLVRNVSDQGLYYIANLKQLRILHLDPPRNERVNRIGRCISQVGIIMLLFELPLLEDLRIESCDLGSTLLSGDAAIAPCNLRKMNCHFVSAVGIQKLIDMCPLVDDFLLTHLSNHNKDYILNRLIMSDLKLARLDFSFFMFSPTMRHLLAIKGKLLTHFSLWEIDHMLTLDAVLCIGRCCPNVEYLSLMTQSKVLLVPKYYRRPKDIFTQLKVLTLGQDNFSIDDMLKFFLDGTDYVDKLILKYQSKTNIDRILLHLLENGCFKNITNLWLDCTLEVTKGVILQIIQLCDKLQMMTVDLAEDSNEIHQFIKDHNYDLTFGSY